MSALLHAVDSGRTVPQRSLPQYARLTPLGSARRHIVIADSAGLLAVARFLTLTNVSVELYLLVDPGMALPSLSVVSCCVDAPALAETIRHVVPGAKIGARFYISGSSVFVAQTDALLKACGLRDDEIQAEVCIGTTQPVFCVHCRTLTAGLVPGPIQCLGCGLSLAIREHFSHRIGAYLGVCINAETPAEPINGQEV